MSTAESYHFVSLLSMVCKIFDKFLNCSLVDNLDKCGLFSDLQDGFGRLNQLQTFWQLHLIELIGLLIGHGATRVVALDISRAFNRV